MHNHVARCCPILVLLVLVGCGPGADAPNLGEVSGRVTLDGEPLANADVTFDPVEPGRTSTGRTNEDGEYTLEYSADTPGAILGAHKVTIRTGNSSVNEDGSVTERPEILPAKYHDATELTVEVTTDGEPQNFDLTSK